MNNIPKFTTKVQIDFYYDSSYRFNNEREANEALRNRLERACKEASKYLDLGHSAKISNLAKEHYSMYLNAAKIEFKESSLKTNLELVMGNSMIRTTYRDLIDDATITERGGKYAYDISNVLYDLQNELNQKVVEFCENAYHYIQKTY